MYISTSLVGMWMFGMCRLLMSHDREMEILAISSACLILSFENSPLPLSLTLTSFNEEYNPATLRYEPRHTLIEPIIIKDRFQF